MSRAVESKKRRSEDLAFEGTRGGCARKEEEASLVSEGTIVLDEE
jgi:hypothetical protein